MYGRYLVTGRWQCFGCHSADFTTVDDLHPERSGGYLGGGNGMPDVTGRIVYSANITPDSETGIGDWTLEQFRRAVVEGIRPDNRPLLYPMVPFRLLTEAELEAMFAYLRSVPAIQNKVPRPEARLVAVGE
jgi:hypothetical protein